MKYFKEITKLQPKHGSRTRNKIWCNPPKQATIKKNLCMKIFLPTVVKSFSI